MLEVVFRLAPGRSRPVRYAELARTLGVESGPARRSRRSGQAVLALRRAKGMVLDAADQDTWSAGSFFTNPVLTRDDVAGAARRTRRAGRSRTGWSRCPRPG